jgi:hypothetical protein
MPPLYNQSCRCEFQQDYGGRLARTLKTMARPILFASLSVSVGMLAAAGRT